MVIVNRQNFLDDTVEITYQRKLLRLTVDFGFYQKLKDIQIVLYSKDFILTTKVNSS